MAGEGSLEVDASYSDIVNSWFSDVHDDDYVKPETIDQEEHIPRVPSSHGQEKKISGVDKKNKIPRAGEKSVVCTDVIGERLNKNLKKAKRKQQAAQKEIKSEEKKPRRDAEADEDEDSKAASVSKGKGVLQLSSKKKVTALLAKIREKGITKSKRKKLKKQLRSILDKSSGDLTKEQRKEAEIVLKGKTKDNKSVPYTQALSSPRGCSEETAVVRKEISISTDEEAEDEAEDVRHTPRTASSPQKQHIKTIKQKFPRRKRQKKRSKQKNIKKDNRPDHLKPPHLRKKTESSADKEQ